MKNTSDVFLMLARPGEKVCFLQIEAWCPLYYFTCIKSAIITLHSHNSIIFKESHFLKHFSLKSVSVALCLKTFPPQGSFFCWKISIECGMKHCKSFCKPCYWPIIAKIFTEDKSFLQFWKLHNFLCETMCWCKQIGFNAPHTY